MSTSSIKLFHNGKSQTVALYDGLGAEELNSLLKTVFGVSGSIVGFQADNGLVIPLSLACKSPAVIPRSVCKLLVAGSKSSEPVQDLEEDSEHISEDESADLIIAEIGKFIKGLTNRNYISDTEARMLFDLLQVNRTLLFAAYSVAISANDSEYFAEICKDLAQSLLSSQGRIACEAQDEVLQVCDQLYSNNKITENQLLYLRHLTLIRDESVASIYDEFQEHESVPMLARDIYRLANTHPYQATQQESSSSATTNVNAATKNTVASSKKATAAKTATTTVTESKNNNNNVTSTDGLSGVIALMIRTRSITNLEASVLLDMVKSDNDYVIAAYELYLRDRNIEDLQDTLIRCARLEIRKRKLNAKENELKNRTKEAFGQYDQVEPEEEDEEDDDEEEEEEEEDAAADKDDDNDNENDEKDMFTFEDIGLDSILYTLNVENIWKKSVPEEFIQIVFIAVIRKQLSIEQAKALCDLYHAQYDLVISAWEVYLVQEDKLDLLDTLKRIVRDLSDENNDDDEEDDEEDEEEEDEEEEDEEEEEKEEPKPVSKPTTTTTTRPTSVPAPTATSISTLSEQEKQLQERKRESMQAVVNAKRDLLKHSVEMMVKQQMITSKQGVDLYERYLRGDILVEAAIDSYANDRNVVEFLETLQIFATHSVEEIERLMKNANEKDDAKTRSANNNNNSSTSTSNTKPASAPAKSQSTSTSTTTSNNAKEASPQAAAPSNIVIAQATLRSIIVELSRNNLIDRESAAELLLLVNNQDKRVITAYQTYQELKDGADLIDTLLRIVSNDLALKKNKGTTTSASNTTQKATTNNSKEDNDDEDEDDEGEIDVEEEEGPLLTISDQKSVIDILTRANAITEDQNKVLVYRIEHGDVELRNIFIQYENDKDVYALIDALKDVDTTAANSASNSKATSSGNNKSAVKSNTEEDEEDDEQDDDGDDDEDDDEDDDIDKEDQKNVEKKFLTIVQKMNLSHLETAALRLAIARNDNGIRQAIDLFRRDDNENALMKALLLVARNTILDTIEEQNNNEEGGGLLDDDGDDEDDDNDKNEDEDDDQDNDKDDEEDDNEDDDDDDDDEEDDDGDDADEESYDEDDEEAEKILKEMEAKERRNKLNQSNMSNTSNNSNTKSSPSWQQKEISRKSQYDYKNNDDNDDDNEEEEEEDDDNEDDDNDDDEDDDDDQPSNSHSNSNGRSLITSQSARDHVFPILINELVKENILSSTQGNVIMKQFSLANPVISTALDVYDSDNDMAQLVETLQQFVDSLTTKKA